MSSPQVLDPPFVDVPEEAPDDPRVGHLLATAASPESAQVVLVGFPSDEGVRINGGRPGASEGPARIRHWLYRMTPGAAARRGAGDGETFRRLLSQTVDIGDVKVTGDVEEDQKRLGKVLAPFLSRGVLPIILGGGHETAYGHFLGYVLTDRPVRIVNCDAHPDVRPPKDGKPHSGSSFYQALLHQSGACAGYRVLGLAPYHCAPSHLAFIESNQGTYVWSEDVTKEVIDETFERSVGGGAVMASFDLDAVIQAEAPGVSAPCAAGLRSELWLRAARASGQSEPVTSFDVVELNPRYDVDDRTARLAALTVWTILSGIAERTGERAGRGT